MKQHLAIVVLLLATTASSEQFTIRHDVAGQLKADFNCVLKLNGVTIADPGFTVSEEAAPGGLADYTFDLLPDSAAGSGNSYTLLCDNSGTTIRYFWPLLTRTPQAVAWRAAYEPIPSQLDVGVGRTLPGAQLRVRGLAADPTGSSVTFSMQSSAGTVVVSAQAASITDIDAVIDPQTGETTWTALLAYSPWQAGDTSTAGNYRAWFDLTFSGGGTMRLPPDKSIRVRVYP